VCLQRANDETKDWAIPLKESDPDTADPFQERVNKKKERVLKNKLQHLKNLERSAAAKGGSGQVARGPSAAALELAEAAAVGVPAGIPKTVSAREGDVSGLTDQGRSKRPRPGGETKDDKAKRLKAAQTATASMGRFDRRLPGESEPPRDPIRHKKRAVVGLEGQERSRDLAVLSALMQGSGEGERAAPASASTKTSKGAEGAMADSKRKRGKRSK
jgi:regulator of ribosome biosynthesis